jgi:hypothetical protein
MTFADLRPYVPGLLGLVVAAFLWFGVRGLVGRVGGWNSLANSYGVGELPSGERFRFASGLMGDELAPVRYKNILEVVVNSSGFGLSIQSVLGKAPSIFIPWIRVESAAQSRAMFVDIAVIRVRGQWPVISLYGRAGVSALQAYRGSLSNRAL